MEKDINQEYITLLCSSSGNYHDRAAQVHAEIVRNYFHAEYEEHEFWKGMLLRSESHLAHLYMKEHGWKLQKDGKFHAFVHCSNGMEE